MRSKLKAKFLVAIVLACLGIGVSYLGVNSVPALRWAGLAMLAVAVIVNLTVRCPECGQHLTGKRTFGVPNYCPNCGKPIQDEETEE